MSVTREVDDHFASLTPEGPLLEHAAAEARAEGLPAVGRTVGQFLEAVVLAAGARRVLEIGTANGYATLWLARSLPDDGGLFSIEIDPRRAAMARAHLEAAGLGDRAHVIVGDPARMVHKVAGPFDVIFNAGDRRQYGPLLDRLAALLRPGGVLVTGNVLQDAEAAAELAGPADRPADEGNRPADEGNRPADKADAVAAYNRRLAGDRRFVTSFLPVGDGLALSVKLR